MRHPLVLAYALLAATSVLAAGNPGVARATADRAVARERFCDAAWLYRRLDDQSPDADVALRAVDALAQGGDRGGAAAMLVAFPTRFPGHALLATAAKRLELITNAIAKVGAGETCPTPPAECGNGLVEGGEFCDDGNRVDADTCPATCAETVVEVTSPPPPPPPPPKVAPRSTRVTPPPPPPPPPEPATTQAIAQDEPEPTTTDRLPADDSSPSLDTDAPVADAAPPVDDTMGSAGVTAPAAAGPPIAGIVLSTVGGVAVIAGGVATVIGMLPAISLISGRGGQAAALADYRAADTNGERRAAAGAAADAYAAQTQDAAAWNNEGRWLAGVGAIGLAAGVGAVVGGIMMLVSTDTAADNGAAIADHPLTNPNDAHDANDANDANDQGNDQ